MHSAGWDSFQREMGQGKLEIFIENTSGLELAEVSAALPSIWGGIGAVVRGPQLLWRCRVQISSPGPVSELHQSHPPSFVSTIMVADFRAGVGTLGIPQNPFPRAEHRCLLLTPL